MKWRFILLFVLLSSLSCMAETVLADEGNSHCTIVYAESNEPLYRTLSEILASLLEKGTGASFPIVAEGQFKGVGNVIYLGPTKAAAAAGIAVPAGHWAYRIEIQGKNIYLLGNDSGKGDTRRRYLEGKWELGTLKAALAFLERFAGACFFGPATYAEFMPSRPKLEVPEAFSQTIVPPIVYGISRSRQLEFDVAVNSFYAPWLFSYGGHSWPRAVPQEKYFKDHPEYFALRKGKRTPTRFNHLCISNPKVSRLVLEEALSKFDEGYARVQVSQEDAFLPCECENCRKLYGIVPTMEPGGDSFDFDPVWSEKVWLFHRDIAEKVKELRPGKEVMLLAYRPHKGPPKSFSAFPSNTAVELAFSREEQLKEWNDVEVPKGLSVYLYNWGFYNREGFFPKMSYDGCKKQAQAFHRYNVRGIYRCGYGEQMLEGPAYYIWGKLLGDSELDTQALLKDYCRFAFPNASAEMEDFFNALEERQKLNVTADAVDFGDPALLENAVVSRENQALLMRRFPDDVLDGLDALLKRAEAKENIRRVRILRTELNYCIITGKAINAFNRFRKTKREEDWQKALHWFRERHRFIADLQWNQAGRAYQEDVQLFGGASREQMKMGGRLSAQLFAPFHWDPELMYEKGIRPTCRVVHVGDKTPQYLVPQQNATSMDEKMKAKLPSFTCTATPTALQVWFVQPSSTYEELKDKSLQLVIGPDEKNVQWFPGRFRRMTTTRYVRRKTSKENNGQGDVYEMLPTSTPSARVTVPAPGLQVPEGTATALFELPFDRLPRVPVKGEKWLFNVIGGDPSFRLIWEPNLDQGKYPTIKDVSGTIVF